MSAEIELRKFPPEHQALRRTTSMDVVFVHGLGGDLIKTWQLGPEQSWPQWVADDHPHVQVWSLGYPAAIGHLLQIGESTQLGTHQLAIAIADRLRSASPSVGTRPCIFVCHSLGGLLIKRVLVEARAQAGADIDAFRHANVAAVMFLGTPHRGSAVATALNMLDGIKNVSAKLLLPMLGLDPLLIANQVLSTSKLIDELKRNSVGLQRLNEDFGLYYAERCRQGALRVRIYEETKPTRVAGVPLRVVVSHDSTDPNLRPHAGAPALLPIPVLDADHSSMVKPSSRDKPVYAALADLIRLVANECGAFNFDEPLRNEVARLVFLAVHQRPHLLRLPSVLHFAAGDTLEAQCRACAEALAARQHIDLLDAVSDLGRALVDLSSLAGAAAADVQALESMAGALILLALGDPAGLVDTDRAISRSAEFEVPVLEGLPDADASEFLGMMIEVCHSIMRKWPARWQLSADKTRLAPGSWILESAALSHPSSWHERDHIEHLTDRILASRAELRPVGGKLATALSAQVAAAATGEDSGMFSPSLPPATTSSMAGDRSRQNRARRLLHDRLKDQIGLVIAAAQPGSPYQSESLRMRVFELFGSLVAVALPAAGQPDDGGLRDRVDAMQATLQQFMLKAQHAQSRVQPHAH